MLLVLSFLISSNPMQMAAYVFVLHSPSPVVLGMMATWQQLSQWRQHTLHHHQTSLAFHRHAQQGS